MLADELFHGFENKSMCFPLGHSEVLEYFLLIFGWTDKDSSSLTISFKTHYLTSCFSILFFPGGGGGGGSSRLILY